MKEFAKLLKQERGRRSWSQEQVAEMIGTTAPNVSRWERGITLPNLYFRQKLSELFEKTAEELSLLDTIGEGSVADHGIPDQGRADQHTAPSACSASLRLWNLPRQRNQLFTGREELLSRLHKALNSRQVGVLTQAHVISGLGGIGKTEMAMEYAYRYNSEYQVILWARAETRDAFLADLAAMAELLHLSEREPSPKGAQQEQRQAVEAVKRWLEQHCDWLLIVDNIEEFTLLQEFIPLTSKAHILLTTCSQFTGLLVQHIDLPKMDPEEGALFLLRRATCIGCKDTLEHATPADRSMAMAISQLLDGLPLALDQAGAYIEEAACSLSHYFGLLQRNRALLLDLRRLSSSVSTDHPHSVYATLSLSFERIKRAAAIDLLRLCAFLHPDAIPEEIITQGGSGLSPLLQDIATDPLKYDAVIAELRRYSLLHRNSDAKTLTIHRLVQAIVRDSMDEALKRQWATWAVQAVNHVFPQVDHWVTSSLCQRYFSHAQVCASLIEEWNIVSVEAGRLLTQLACYLYELSQHELTQYEQAEPLLEKALGILTQILGEEHPEVAETQQSLGWVYVTNGKYARAEACYQRALAIHERLPEPNHRSISGCLADLAEIYEEQGKYSQAECFYQRALAIQEQLGGPDHLDIVVDLRNLGKCYIDQGQYARAEPLLLRALDIWRRALGMEHPFTASILSELGRLYLKRGHYAQAESPLLQALEIRRKVLQPGHPHLAYSLNGLGRFYLEQKYYAQAESPLLQALEIRQKAQGPEHREMVPILKNLARLCYAKGESIEAELFLRRALAICQKVMGPEHPQTIRVLNHLAAFSADTEQWMAKAT